MTEQTRRSLPRAEGGKTLARPALRGEVMAALHCRPPGLLDRTTEIEEVQRLLQPRDWGVYSALLALAEYGLVDVYPRNELSGRPARVCLTETGRAWKVAPSGLLEPWDEEPMRYVYRLEGTLAVGTIADLAKAWENAHYYGPPGPDPVVLTWLNRDPGYQVQVDQVTPQDRIAAEDDWTTYRVWVAGEHTTFRIDGRN